MALDLDYALRHLEKFVDQSGGGWMTDEAGLTALVIEMKEAGLVDAEIERDDQGIPFGAIVVCVTRDGHDFLDAAKKPALWDSIKERCHGRPLREVAEAVLTRIR